MSTAILVAVIALIGVVLTAAATVLAARISTVREQNNRILVATDGALTLALQTIQHNTDRIERLEMRIRAMEELGVLAALGEPDA